MIRINYTIGDKTDTALFPKTRQGDLNSVKFIKSLYAERKAHPWYKAKELECLLENSRIGREKRTALKNELDQLQNSNNPLAEPIMISLSITTE